MYKFGCSQYKCFLNAFFSYQKCIRWRYEGLQDEVSAIILFSNIFLFHFLQHFLYAFTNDIQCPLKFTHFYTHRKLYTRGSNSCTSHFFDVTILTAGYKIWWWITSSMHNLFQTISLHYNYRYVFKNIWTPFTSLSTN